MTRANDESEPVASVTQTASPDPDAPVVVVPLPSSIDAVNAFVRGKQHTSGRLKLAVDED